jgi:HEAT repeat protein
LSAVALGEIADERARPALVSALGDTAGDVRRAAAAALEALGPGPRI